MRPKILAIGFQREKVPTEILVPNFGANMGTYNRAIVRTNFVLAIGFNAFETLTLNLNGVILEIERTFFRYSKDKLSWL